MNIEQGLVNWGLTEKEAKVYNSLAKRIECSAYQLFLDTKIPKTTIYEILEKLTNLGLVSSSRKNGIKNFTAESPNRLVRILEEKMDITKELVPLLLSRPHNDANPNVKLYLGSDGKNKVLEDILDTCERAKQKELFVIPGLELYDDIPKYMKKWIKRKEAMKLFSLVITEDNPEHIAPKIYQNSIYRETRLIQPEYMTTTGINIYPGKVALYSKVNNIEHSMIIESPSIHDSFKRFFMFMWAHATKSVNENANK